MLIDICLPIYNEEKILLANSRRLLNYCQSQNWDWDWRLILLVNGSTDNSLAIAQKLADDYPDRAIAKNYQLAGKGQTLKTYGLSSPADIMVYMDADLSADFQQLPQLIQLITDQDADLAMGSRLLPESQTKRSLLREIISRSYNFLSRLILNHKFSDLQCGFKAVKLPAFRQLARQLSSTPWFFDTEMVMLAKHSGYNIKELPINWSENRYQTRPSAVNLFTAPWPFIINLIKLRKKLKNIKLD